MSELPEETNQELSFDWFKSNSNKQTEGMIIAAQDHSLLPRLILSKFNDISHFCNEKPKHLCIFYQHEVILQGHVIKNVTTELQGLFIILKNIMNTNHKHPAKILEQIYTEILI